MKIMFSFVVYNVLHKIKNGEQQLKYPKIIGEKMEIKL